MNGYFASFETTFPLLTKYLCKNILQLRGYPNTNDSLLNVISKLNLLMPAGNKKVTHT